MARDHFAQFMTSPQFNHACDDEHCKVTEHHKKDSIIKKILKKVGIK
jgi:hypothetical protein